MIVVSVDTVGNVMINMERRIEGITPYAARRLAIRLLEEAERADEIHRLCQQPATRRKKPDQDV